MRIHPAIFILLAAIVLALLIAVAFVVFAPSEPTSCIYMKVHCPERFDLGG